MGTEYVLAKHGKREFYDLGKGPWPSVFRLRESFHATSAMEITAGLGDDWASDSYRREIAAAIVAWAGADEVEMLADTSDWPFAEETHAAHWQGPPPRLGFYRETGTRYRDVRPAPR